MFWMLLIVGLSIFVISLLVNAFILKYKDEYGYNEKTYIEPNEYMTIQDCLDMYYHDNKRMIIENGQVTKII